jgi:hypothetical protein
MKPLPLDGPMFNAIRELELPKAGETSWGVPIMGTDRFRQITSTRPTGFSEFGNVRPHVVIEWRDRKTGGVACMLKRPSERDTRFAKLPYAVHEGMVSNPYDRCNNPGMKPGIYGKEDIGYAATHLGYMVLANTRDLIAVQCPGTDDYVTAYRHVNGNETPGILPNSKAYFPQGRRFLDIIAKGWWPRDRHFFEIHGPAFVIGGSALIDEMRSLARNVPDDEVNQRGGFLDEYGGDQQISFALERVSNYRLTGDPSALYDIDFGFAGELVPIGHRPNVEMMAKFNAYVANSILQIVIPNA